MLQFVNMIDAGTTARKRRHSGWKLSSRSIEPATFDLADGRSVVGNLENVDQLDFEMQGRVGRNRTRHAHGTVTQFGWNLQLDHASLADEL